MIMALKTFSIEVKSNCSIKWNRSKVEKKSNLMHWLGSSFWFIYYCVMFALQFECVWLENNRFDWRVKPFFIQSNYVLQKRYNPQEKCRYSQ